MKTAPEKKSAPGTAPSVNAIGDSPSPAVAASLAPTPKY
jgi:hypothetical protein